MNNLILIKQYLDIDRVIHLDVMTPFVKGQLRSFIVESSQKRSGAIVLSIPMSINPIHIVVGLLKLKYFLHTAETLLKKERFVWSTYGVYPRIERPAFIFELDKASSEYAEKYFLPNAEKGFKGLIKEVVHRLIKVNPSIAGIVIKVD